MATLQCPRAGCRQLLQAGATYCSSRCRSSSRTSSNGALVAGAMIVPLHDIASSTAAASGMIESTPPIRAHRAPRQEKRNTHGSD